MPSPIKLSDDELAAIMTACQPLRPASRDGFVPAVAAALQGREVGPGTVHRAIVEAQRQHFDPPNFNGNAATGKWGRG